MTPSSRITLLHQRLTLEMPFKSRAQQKMMWATNPKLAARFQSETHGKLPDKVKKKKKKR